MVLTMITVPEVPNNYTATLGADGTLEGTFVDSHNESGHFKLTNTYHLPAPKDNFRAQSVWSVLCTISPVWCACAIAYAWLRPFPMQAWSGACALPVLHGGQDQERQ